MIKPPTYKGLQEDGHWAFGRLTIVKDVSQWLKEVNPGHYISNWEGAPLAYKVIPETVCECTNRKDSNGESIYSDDIIQYGEGATFIIKRGKNGCWIGVSSVNDRRMFYLDTLAEHYPVVGNTHDIKD